MLRYLPRHHWLILCSCKSFQPERHCPPFSTAFRIAMSPPAMIPFTKSKGTPKVGGHSDASTI
jgi:hypothetical protein